MFKLSVASIADGIESLLNTFFKRCEESRRQTAEHRKELRERENAHKLISKIGEMFAFVPNQRAGMKKQQTRRERKTTLQD